MGRGRSSTNYNNAEKQLLLRAIASVKPRKASCWHAIADYYNAHRSGETTVGVERDAHSLKRKFKTMVATQAPRDGELDDPYAIRAQKLMQQMKDRAIALSNGQPFAEDDDDDDDDEINDENNSESDKRTESSLHRASVPAAKTRTTRPAPAAAAPAPVVQLPTRDDQRRLHALAPLLPGPPTVRHSTQVTTTTTKGAPVARTATAPPSVGGGDASDVAQLLLVIREENAQREATRRAEWEQALAREERFRQETRELRRQEREEAAAREERYWHAMAEQRRIDREETAARHEQMMMVLGALIKPTADSANGTRTSRSRDA